MDISNPFRTGFAGGWEEETGGPGGRDGPEYSRAVAISGIPVNERFRHHPAMTAPILLVTAVVAALLFCAGFASGLGWPWMLALKLIPVTAAIVWVQRDGLHGRYANAITVGLTLSVLGDALLALPGDLFVAGLLAFLAAHLAYTAAYVGRSRALAPAWLLMSLLAVGLMLAVLFQWGELGAMKLPVVVYAVVIGLMLWRAGAQGRSGSGAHFAVLGAVLFVLSDAVLAWNRFVDHHDNLRYLNIALYWLGQWGIAASAVQGHRETPLPRL